MSEQQIRTLVRQYTDGQIDFDTFATVLAEWGAWGFAQRMPDLFYAAELAVWDKDAVDEMTDGKQAAATEHELWERLVELVGYSRIDGQPVPTTSGGIAMVRYE